ncbi:MAG: VWA domain-containing protein [Myxococcales bacterium]|nr:VWA domain-containing protein [Myxococcales bacterium]
MNRPIALLAAAPLAVITLTLAACGSSARDPNAAGRLPDGGAAATSDFVPSEAGPASADGGVCPNVDVLFVVDNSGSMADKQARLAQSFPGFAAALQKRLPAAKSVHVGVVSTSAYYAGAPQECLIRKTEGPASSASQCLPAGAFLTTGESDFASRFACVAKVGAGGDDDETPMKSLLGALSDKTNAPSGCNAGFSRRDALLIVVLITDEDDVRESDCDPTTFSGTCGSGGDPDAWAQTVIAHKGGHKENVLVLSLVSKKSGDCSNVIGANVSAFTHRFGQNGFVGDVCSATYDKFFEDALPLFDQACTTFVPPPK